jgi:serine/threonine protein kinase
MYCVCDLIVISTAALSYLHSNNIIHRDLKLDNIFLHNMSIKIGDLGLSVKITDSEKKTYPSPRRCSKFVSSLCGTPNYIAPEVLHKSGYSFPVGIL